MTELSGAALPVSEARANLTGILREFREAEASGRSAEPVVIGSHRHADAVLVPAARFRELIGNEARNAPQLPLLRRRRELIDRLARANRIERVEVFGSVAWGTDDASSDIDVLVDPSDDATLFDLAQFEIDLEALLERQVDVVSRRALDPERDRGILTEAVPI